MASRDVEAEVLGLIADQLDLASDKIAPTDRLQQDLGVGGADAAELFGMIADRFGTDLTLLHKRWHTHFRPTRIPLGAAIVMSLAAVAGGVIAGAANLGLVAGLIIVIVLVGASFWLLVGRLLGPVVQIRVDEIVSAVTAGSWAFRRR